MSTSKELRRQHNGDAKQLQLTKRVGKSEAAQMAEAALCPAVNAAILADAYQGHVFGDSVEVTELMNALQASMGKSNSGDLTELENMLIGQATALQTIFVSLARRAQGQQYQKNLEAFLGLALKAQAQSRATIQAVIDLKFPRQATFVKQANIANGPQQVNNGTAAESTGNQATRLEFPESLKGAPARALKNQTEQIEVLEGVTHGRTQMDARATAEATGGHTAVEAVATVHRPQKLRRQG